MQKHQQGDQFACAVSGVSDGKRQLRTSESRTLKSRIKRRLAAVDMLAISAQVKNRCRLRPKRCFSGDLVIFRRERWS
jgi:hypothetical protein